MATPERNHPGVPPGYLQLTDAEGLRHVVRASAVQLLSDGDPCRDSTLAVVAGRSLTILMPLEQMLERLDGCTVRRL